MLTVYFDGKCGLCSREITYYKGIAPEGAIDWRDIARDPAPLEALGVSQADALMLLHARAPDGQILVGVDAFTAIWRALPYWRRLAPIVDAPGVRHIANWMYRSFAAWRFRRQPHCMIAASERDAAARSGA